MESDKTMGDNKPDNLCPIVGIGASAGGLHALDCFLEALPKDFDFAIVFIQHLSPGHKSLMPEILRSKWRDHEFIEIEDGLQLLPGRIYLCQPAIEVRIHEGAFRVIAKPDEHIHFPIDEFLVSLAEDSAERAVAVIFSGAGTDGVRGIQAIRTEGGTVFVQDPATAQFPALPQAAIKTGQVDSVLPPPDIAREIVKLLRSGAVTGAPEELMSPAELDLFYLLIREKTGHRFNHYKKTVISRRIRRRMYLRGSSSFTEYLKVVADKRGEAALLASDLMIGVTSFFRDRLAWKALRIGVISKMIVDDKDAPIRVWTPACATGEESYSIAMMLRDELDLAGSKRELQVFATDVNDASLEKAREGKYPASIAADVPADYLRKFFTYTDDSVALSVSKELRQQVLFAKQDLLTDPPFSRLDLVICRNLLIYLEPEAQEKCITLFHYALRPGGYLFLGGAESPGKKGTLFKSLAHKKCRVYEKVEIEHPSRLPLTVPFAAERAAVRTRQQPYLDPRQLSQDTLLEEFAPAAVTIDQNYEIIYHNGPTNTYLTQPRGAPTQNLLELMPENLRNRIRGAIYKVTQEVKPVSIRAGIARNEGQKRQVSIRVSKIKDNLFLILFREKAGQPSEASSESPDTVSVEEPVVRQLEIELSATRQELQTNIEQLKSLNEEFQSSNEELQASNEELETSREELQSLNEELITVNTQLQSKVEEQEETNNDLNNFLSSTNLPTIFLDHRFRVKRYTPAITKVVKLIPSDLGRQIIDMSQEFLGPDLISDAQSVLENLVPVRREIVIKGAWYIRSALPYRTLDDRIEGVVITYNDVTELKRAEEHSRHLASFPQLNPNPIIEIDSSGKVIFCNPGALETLKSLGLDKSEVTVFLPKDLDIILKDLDKDSEFSVSREVSIKDRVYGETIHLIPHFNVARIYAFDLTEIKKAEEVQGRLAAIVESAEDAIIGKDLNGIIQTWNVGAENVFGYKAEEVIGRPVSILVPPGHTDEVPGILAGIKQGEHIEQFETVRMRKDGTTIPVSLTFSAVKDASGRIVGASKIAHDITERKRAEEKIVRAKEEWERTFASVPDMIAILDNQQLIVRVNEAMARRLGRRPEDCVGLHCYEAIHGLTEPPAFCPHTRTMKDGKEHTEEVHEDRLGGDFVVSTTPFYDGQGQMIGSIHVAHDISASKKAENIVQARLRMLAAAPNLSLDEMLQMALDEIEAQTGSVIGFYHFLEDDQETLLLQNWSTNTLQNMCTAEGKSSHYPVSKAGVWVDCVTERRPVIHNDYKSLPHLKGMPPGHAPVIREMVIPILRGERIVAIIGVGNKSTDYDATDVQIASLLGDFSWEIVERKRAEEALRESEERHRGLFEHMFEGFAYCKMVFENGKPQDFIYLSVNHAFETLTGLKNVVGKKATEVIPGIREADPELFEVYGRVALFGIPERFETYVQALKMWFSISVYSPKKGHFVAIFDVITERKRAEEEIKRLNDDLFVRNEKLEFANKELESFIYSVSHDMRGPLRHISGFADLLMKDIADQLDEKGKRYFYSILNGTEKMSRLIDDLLNLSSITRQEIQRREVNVSTIAASIVAELREAQPDRSVEVEIKEGITAFADPGLIEVVIMNLLGNAWKFTSKADHARIEFGTVEQDGKMIYYVGDNGAGFDQKYMGKMFWPFHRLHSESAFEGTGIGLAIVDRIISRHGGKVWAQGIEGKGATVYFSLT